MRARFFARVLALATGCVAFAAQAQSVTVVEYYNTSLDAYFITGRTDDQAALDAASTVFRRTGMTFQATAAASATSQQTKICRFYITSTTPYTSSHFYGRQGVDCESIRNQNLRGFQWEDYDFATLQPTNNICPAGSVGIYRGFRAAAGGKTSNHRYSASLASYNAAVSAGFAGENIAFCATSATAASSTTTPPPVTGTGDCGAFVESKKRITSQTTANTMGVSSTTVSTISYDFDLTPVTFNGRSAARQFATTTTAGNSNISTPSVTYFQDSASSVSILGSRDSSKTPVQDTYFDPPYVYPKQWTAGQKVDYSHSIVFNPAQPTLGTGNQVGTTTFLGRESVTVPAGTFNACKFKIEQTTRYPNGLAASTSITNFTSWSVPGVGNVKSEGSDTSVVSGFNIVSNYTIVATAIE